MKVLAQRESKRTRVRVWVKGIFKNGAHSHKDNQEVDPMDVMETMDVHIDVIQEIEESYLVSAKVEEKEQCLKQPSPVMNGNTSPRMNGNTSPSPTMDDSTSPTAYKQSNCNFSKRFRKRDIKTKEYIGSIRRSMEFWNKNADVPVTIPHVFRVREKHYVGGKEIPFTRYNAIAQRNKINFPDTIYESCRLFDFKVDDLICLESRALVHPSRGLAITFIQP